jgi:hypothetical protein
MGITVNELARLYPRLYHMAHRDSWASIQEHGLLSTSALLDLFEKNGEEREKLETRHRPESVTITHPVGSAAVVRDQKPMSDEGLRRALGSSGLAPADWYRILNSKVFFWLTEERLARLLGANAYREDEHCVLTVDTRSILADHENDVRLCPINSGCTKPFPWPRDGDTFLTMTDYPFEDWFRRRAGHDPVVEVAIEQGVRDITKYVLRVELRQEARISTVLYVKE